MKKKLIAICIMFAFAFAMPAAQAVEPAYVSVEAPTMQAEAIGKGKVTTAQINVERRSESAVAASANRETTYSQEGWEDRYSVIAGIVGVSGGDSIGISKTS